MQLNKCHRRCRHAQMLKLDSVPPCSEAARVAARAIALVLAAEGFEEKWFYAVLAETLAM